MQVFAEPPEPSCTAKGQMLLDASMFWGPAGGVRRIVRAKHERLPALGWRHAIVAPGVAADRDLDGSTDCGGLALPGSGGYRVVLSTGRVRRLIEAAQPDLVEAADPYTVGRAALAAAESLGVPAVAYCHSHLPSALARWVGGAAAEGTPHGRWAARHAAEWLASFYERFDLVLAPSEHVAADLRRWGLTRVAVQPPGVDTRTFRPEAANALWRANLCRRLGLAAGTTLLVYAGRFAAEKNLPLLAAAVARLGPGYALLAIGNGPAPPRGERVVRMAPVADGRRLARIVASADAFVHAGDRETFGLAALEAMACGTPLVAAAAGGTGELARGVATTVAGRRVEDWAEAIAAAVATGRGARTARALDRARGFDWTPVLAAWSRRYLGLLERHAARPARAGAAPAATWA